MQGLTQSLLKRRESSESKQGGGGDFFLCCFREGPVILQLLLITLAVWEQEKNPHREGGREGRWAQCVGEGPIS